MTESTAKLPAQLRVPESDHEVLRSALSEIATGGYVADSFARIAADAGVSIEELADRYPDERTLLVDALRFRDELGAREMPSGHADGRRMLQSWLEIARDNAALPGLVAVFATLSAAATSPDHPGHDYFRDRYAWLRDLLVDALRELEEEGELKRRSEPEDAAAMAVALFDGLQVQWLLDPSAVDVERLMREFLNRYLHTPLSPSG